MNAARWRLEVDRQLCISSGMCAALAPRHFALEGRAARPLRDEVEQDEAILAAAESCPVRAIQVKVAADGALVAPLEE